MTYNYTEAIEHFQFEYSCPKLLGPSHLPYGIYMVENVDLQICIIRATLSAWSTPPSGMS